jgi:hypothetical protein
MHPHATAGYRTWRRYLSGADASASFAGLDEEMRQRGFSAGQKDALSKQPQNVDTAWAALYDTTTYGPTSDTFRKGYLAGYGDVMVEMDKVAPGASAQLTLLNLAEGTKIDRDTDPEAFNHWVQEQAKKPGFDSAMTLGLAALTGVATITPDILTSAIGPFKPKSAAEKTSGSKSGADAAATTDPIIPAHLQTTAKRVAIGAGVVVAGVVGWKLYDSYQERRMEDAHRATQQRLWRQFVAADEHEERMRGRR